MKLANRDIQSLVLIDIGAPKRLPLLIGVSWEVVSAPSCWLMKPATPSPIPISMPQAGVSQKVSAATIKQTRKIESEYDKELKNVKAANKEGGPEAEKAAAAKM